MVPNKLVRFYNSLQKGFFGYLLSLNVFDWGLSEDASET